MGTVPVVCQSNGVARSIQGAERRAAGQGNGDGLTGNKVLDTAALQIICRGRRHCYAASAYSLVDINSAVLEEVWPATENTAQAIKRKKIIKRFIAIRY